MHSNKKRIFLLATVLLIKTASASPTLTNSITNNTDGKHWSGHITVKNLPHSGTWQLGFTYASGPNLYDVKGGKIIRTTKPTAYGSVGGFYLIEFVVPKNRSDVEFDLLGNYAIKSYSVAPAHYFLIDSPGTDHAAIQPVKEKIEITTIGKIPAEIDYKKNQKKNNQAIENNLVEVIHHNEKIAIVPLPAEIIEQEGGFVFTKKTPIFYADSIAAQAAQFFASAIGKKRAVQYKGGQLSQPAILLTTAGSDALTKQQQAEGYLLSVTSKNIVIRAASAAGFFYAIQSLRQLLPPELFSQRIKKTIPAQWKVACVEIKDYPRFSYRGLHLDVARHFIPEKQVKRLLDLMAIHKLNYFQWHLTDDEGWRIEIKKYPELTQIGAWRGFDIKKKNFQHNLYPAFGSGSQAYGGFYTQKQIRDIVEYAKQRHITIIPEIEMPGHARAMIMSLPQQLIDPQDLSKSTSVQGYKDNVLSPCINSTYEVIDHIVKEVAELFPGKYLHIGGDEVPFGVWKKSAACQNLANSLDKNFREKIHHYFNQKVQTILSHYHKTMTGWEEIANEASELTSPLLVYVWNAEKFDQVYGKSKENSYDVIVSLATNLYFDLAYDKDAREPGFYWVGYVGTYEPYAMVPIPAGKNADVIKGVQGQIWTETILDPNQGLDYVAFPKVAGLAEMAWSPAVKRNWRDFSIRMGLQHLPRLDFYGVKYRVSPPGIHLQDGWLRMNNEFPGTKMLYSADGSAFKVYQEPVKVLGNVRAKAVSVTGRESREAATNY